MKKIIMAVFALALSLPFAAISTAQAVEMHHVVRHYHHHPVRHHHPVHHRVVVVHRG